MCIHSLCCGLQVSRQDVKCPGELLGGTNLPVTKTVSTWTCTARKISHDDASGSLYDFKQNQRKRFHFFIYFRLWLHIPFYVYNSIIILSTYGSFGFSVENSIRLLCLIELLVARLSAGSIFLPFTRKFRQNAMCCYLLSKPCLLDFSEFYSLRDNCTSNHILIKHSNQYNHLLILILSSK